MNTDRSSAQALTIAQQLARLRLGRFFYEGTGLTNSNELELKGIKSSPGAGGATGGGQAAELAWEVAMTAQYCAYLAIELQVWAQRFVDQRPTSPDSTYRRLSSSAGIFRALLANMHKKFSALNKKEENNEICVISEDLAEAILSMWAQDNLTITVECMTSIESQGTSNTNTVGDTS